MNQFNTTKKAFTMIELVFVIVIIGILSAIAVPKFAATRDDAIVSKTRSTVASIRSSLATERQKRILRGIFNPIYRLSASSGAGVPIFEAFNANASNPVLAYPLTSCSSTTSSNCWKETVAGAVDNNGKVTTVAEYTFYATPSSTAVFELKNNRFTCKTATDLLCKDLTK